MALSAVGDGLVLALDQGSHASRAVVFDTAGEEVAQARVPVGTSRPAADRVEHDPAELVQSLRLAARDALDSAAPGDRPVVAAGLATQRSTVVCWERATGRPLSPALSWQDRRNAAWLERLAPRAARIRELTGLELSPHYGASKLRWCLDHADEVRAAAAAGTLAAGPLSSFLVARLAEERPCLADPANASRTQLYDAGALDWSDELLELFSLERACLPACVPTRHAFGTISVGSHRVPLTACTGDQSAAAFAFGRPGTGTALVNVGTGAFVQRVAPPGAALPPRLLQSVLWSDGTTVLRSHEGTVNGAGSAIEWLRERVAIDVDRALASLAPRAAGDEPPLFMNGVGGLGAPFWRADFPIEFVGAGNDLARLVAVLESVVFLACVNLEALRRAAPLDRVHISGGLARSDLLCQDLADLAGLPVQRFALGEATARGAAFIAAGEPRGWRTVPVERVFTPAGHAALGARFDRWRAEMARRGAAA